MSVPIFQKGELFQLKEIVELVNKDNHSFSETGLSQYSEGYFEYKGINLKKEFKHTFSQITELKKEIECRISKSIELFNNKDTIYIFVSINDKIYSTVMICQLDLENKDNMIEVAKIITEQLNNLILEKIGDI